MTRLGVAVCLLGSLGGTGFAQETDKPKAATEVSLLAKGQLPQVGTHLGKILQFTFAGPRLALDRKGWGADPQEVAGPARIRTASPVETLFRQIQAAAGSRSSGMTLSGRDRTLTFTGTELHGRLDIRGDAVRLSLEEARSPQRHLEFSEDGQGGLRLQVTHPEGDLILLSQIRKGKFTAVALQGGQVLTGQGDSFFALLRQHRQLMDGHVLPVLEHFGIQVMPSLNSSKLRKAVLAQVLRTPESLAEGQKLIHHLDSEKFDLRDQATRTLVDRFELYKDLIQEKLQDKTISLEMRTRLEKILAEQGDSLRISQTVAALELTRDADYLVSLLDHIGPKELPRLIRHLERTTGRKLGADPKAWKAWAGKQRP